MTCILLIRHGSTDLSGRVLYGRMPGVHLNEDGLRQARVVAEKLKDRYSLDAVVTSPLERAMETATPIAEAQSVALEIDDGIIEIDFGDWVGKSFDDLGVQQRWKDFNEQRCTTCPPGGETMMSVQARAWLAIDRIARKHSGGSVAIVTHGDVIRAILVLLLGMSLDHIHRIEIAPASVSEVLVGERHPLVRSMNVTY